MDLFNGQALALLANCLARLADNSVGKTDCRCHYYNRLIMFMTKSY